jgi:hypothetical protein
MEDDAEGVQADKRSAKPYLNECFSMQTLYASAPLQCWLACGLDR